MYVIEFSATSFKCPVMSKSIYFFPFYHAVFYIYLNDCNQHNIQNLSHLYFIVFQHGRANMAIFWKTN